MPMNFASALAFVYAFNEAPRAWLQGPHCSTHHPRPSRRPLHEPPKPPSCLREAPPATHGSRTLRPEGWPFPDATCPPALPSPSCSKHGPHHPGAPPQVAVHTLARLGPRHLATVPREGLGGPPTVQRSVASWHRDGEPHARGPGSSPSDYGRRHSHTPRNVTHGPASTAPEEVRLRDGPTPSRDVSPGTEHPVPRAHWVAFLTGLGSSII